MKHKIDQMFQDINNLYDDFDRGKLKEDEVDSYIKTLCRWYLKK